MPSNLNFHFDPELFLLNWRAAVDPTLTALYESGAVVDDDTIRQMIANGGNFYTIPQYAPLLFDNSTNAPQNYDGNTNVSGTETSDVAQSGVVFSRMKSWLARDFVRDFNRADPMGSITAQVAKYWNKYRQSLMIGLLNAVFGITGNAAWTKHTTNLVVTSATAATAANKMGATTVGDAIQAACGDNKGIFSLAVMHSKVAQNLANLDLLEFRKYTDAQGITRQLNIADINGLTVIVDDGVPTAANSKQATETDYTTYLLGAGAILRADAPIEHPVEQIRDAITNGGQEQLITRVRETMHPNGFSFAQPANMAVSPADAVLTATANWSIIADPKTIAMARIITNG